MSGERKAWNAMRGRLKLASYIERGTEICEAWQDYEAFRQWLVDQCWEPGLELHRVDNLGHYEPDNVVLLTKTEHRKARAEDEATVRAWAAQGLEERRHARVEAGRTARAKLGRPGGVAWLAGFTAAELAALQPENGQG